MDSPYMPEQQVRLVAAAVQEKSMHQKRHVRNQCTWVISRAVVDCETWCACADRRPTRVIENQIRGDRRLGSSVEYGRGFNVDLFAGAQDLRMNLMVCHHAVVAIVVCHEEKIVHVVPQLYRSVY